MKDKNFLSWIANNSITANLISGAVVSFFGIIVWALSRRFLGVVVNETITTAISALTAAVAIVFFCWCGYYLHDIIKSDSQRKKFWESVQSDEFKRFSVEVMVRYYGERFFTKVNGIYFPVFVVPGKSPFRVTSISDFDVLCDSHSSKLTDFDIMEHAGYKDSLYYREYSYLLEGKIKYPDRPGYMLDEIHLDGDGAVDKVSVHVGTFAENVYTCHVLEYELYRAYLKYEKALRKKRTDQYWITAITNMVVRNRIHGDVGGMSEEGYFTRMSYSLRCGHGRHSLLSVQMLFVVKSKRTGKYEVKIAQRSSNVAISPNIYQFIPAGGFEILNDSDDEIYDDKELAENFSPGCAVFREFLEELFSAPEFEGRGPGSVIDRVLNDPRIRMINEMLKDGRASMQFLGSVMDLRGLRHELSFVLVIHDVSYSDMQFIGNEECKKGRVMSIPIDEFDADTTIWKNIHGPSAVMWGLFKQSELFRKISQCAPGCAE